MISASIGDKSSQHFALESVLNLSPSLQMSSLYVIIILSFCNIVPLTVLQQRNKWPGKGYNLPTNIVCLSLYQQRKRVAVWESCRRRTAAVPFDLEMPRTPERAYLAVARAMVIQVLDTVLAYPVSHWNPVGMSLARSNASQAFKRVPSELATAAMRSQVLLPLLLLITSTLGRHHCGCGVHCALLFPQFFFNLRVFIKE